jgi:hypothetical protein
MDREVWQASFNSAARLRRTHLFPWVRRAPFFAGCFDGGKGPEKASFLDVNRQTRNGLGQAMFAFQLGLRIFQPDKNLTAQTPVCFSLLIFSPPPTPIMFSAGTGLTAGQRQRGHDGVPLY